LNRWLYISLAATSVLSCIACSSSTAPSPSFRTSCDDANSIVVCDPRALSSLLIDVSGMSVASVVTVRTNAAIEEETQSTEFPWSAETTHSNYGSGVIIREDGYIVTNSHVIGNAEEVTVTLPSGEDIPAILVGSDPGSDIALLKIEIDFPIKAIEMGNSDDLMVGEMILSIGSPFALSQTVSLGIVSFLDRRCPGLANYENFIQTDAAINPGNSGGALVNLDGKLVGVCTAFASRNGMYQGIGFAVPVNAVRSIVNDLILSGEVRRNWLGACLQEVQIDYLENSDTFGAVVLTAILSASPAESAGLERGDIVIAIDGSRFASAADFRNRIAGYEPDAEILLTVMRDGVEQLIPVHLK